MRKASTLMLVLSASFWSSLSSAQVLDKVLTDPQTWQLALQTGEGVSVIVHLTRDSEVTFQKNAQVEDVATAVAVNQHRFVSALKRSGLAHQKDQFGQGERGFRVTKLMTYQHAVVGNISDLKTLHTIMARDDVRFVERNKTYKLQTVEGRTLTQSTEAGTNGWRGQGVGVAVIDSNVDLLHPELGGNVNLPNNTVFGGRNFSADNNVIHSRDRNDCFHGTAVASIVHRYAPDAHLYPLVVFPLATDANVADAINWSITNRNGVNGGNPIRVISMSLGSTELHTGQCNTGLLHEAAGDALANDILVLAGSGNDGRTNAMASPACSSNVISIGAAWDENGAAYTPFPPANCNDNNRQRDERTCYSNTSWALDLYAPSEEVICANCGGGTAAFGGTSAATPAAAGMLAQLLSLDPGFAGDLDGVVDLFTDTGDRVTGNFYPRSRMNIGAATRSCSAQPAQPAYISGPDRDLCPNSTGTFQTPVVDNADHYQWEVVGSPLGTRSSTPQFTLHASRLTPGRHTLRVRTINCAGVSGWRTANIWILSRQHPQCRSCTGRDCPIGP